MLPSYAEIVSLCSTLANNLTNDLQHNLVTGQAFLQGRSIYQGHACFYPLPLIIPYALLSLLPLRQAWAVLFVANFSILLSLFRLRAFVWLLYAPTFYAAVSGQNDLWFMFFERCLTFGTGSAMLAALITLKPQLALILLPFHLQRWWREDRQTLKRFFAFSALIWFTPWTWAEWFAKIQTSTLNLHCAPSIWAACGGKRMFPLPTVVLVALSLYLVYIAMKSKREICIPALQLAAPMGMGYNTAVLTGLAPAWLLLPVSWLIGLLVMGVSPIFLDAFVFLPILVLLYQRRRAETSDPPAAYART